MEPLNKTSIVIQLADRSFVYPLGVIEDVLVKIDSLGITSILRQQRQNLLRCHGRTN
jgi:hypothetical protein